MGPFTLLQFMDELHDESNRNKANHMRKDIGHLIQGVQLKSGQRIRLYSRSEDILTGRFSSSSSLEMTFLLGGSAGLTVDPVVLVLTVKKLRMSGLLMVWSGWQDEVAERCYGPKTTG